MLNVEGLVLARNVGNEDWVRLAPAIDPMASPPVSAMSRIRLRYVPRRRARVPRNRYHATFHARLLTGPRPFGGQRTSFVAQHQCCGRVGGYSTGFDGDQISQKQ